MLVVGLTGGIGSGKSTAALRFTAHGVPVIDADQIVRDLVKPGSPALLAIVEKFGNAVLDQDGALDRPRLRRIVFENPERRRSLEAVLHPLVRCELAARVRSLETPYCVVSIPLLIESRMADLVDRVLVVDLPEGLQYQRALSRGRLSSAELRAIMAAQAERGARLAAADDVIANDADQEKLYRQVDELHQRYSRLAEQHI
jgi:dephospho-CoA kinase